MMATAIISLFAALIVFLILTETITLNFKIGENYIIEINFMVFAIVFEKGKSKHRSKRKSKSKRNTDFRFWYFLVSLLLPYSNVKINSLALYFPKSNPTTDAILYAVYNGVVSSFLSVLENNSNFLNVSNITVSSSEHNTLKKHLDAELKFSLLDVIIAFVKHYILLIYDKLHQRRIRKIK